MKVFCIGFNKTGTTSLGDFFSKNNIKVAPQKPFEYNLESYFYGNYSTFIKMIENDYSDYIFFQDVPFSFPLFYKNLDEKFENSKFILTVRDNEHVWYESLIRFYKKMFFHFDTPEKINRYVYDGIIYKILTKVYGAPNNTPYDEVSLKKAYLNHIEEVKKYFSNKENLLIINLKQDDVVLQIQEFLKIEFPNKKMPHLNKSL